MHYLLNKITFLYIRFAIYIDNKCEFETNFMVLLYHVSLRANYYLQHKIVVFWSRIITQKQLLFLIWCVSSYTAFTTIL